MAPIANEQAGTESFSRIRSAWLPTRELVGGSSVFHYTTSAGLLGILQTGTMWATEAGGLNDLAEILQGETIIRGVLEQEALGDVEDAILSVIESPFAVAERGPGGVYVLSASTRGDDANQWRLYGDDGRGYCVELDSTRPMIVRSHLPAHRQGKGLAAGIQLLEDSARLSNWSPVLYDKVEQQAQVRELVTWAKERLHYLLNHRGNEVDGYTPWDQLQYDLELAVASLASVIKAEGFAGEAEARVHMSFSSGDRHVEYRPSPHGVTRYAKLSQATKSDLGGVWFSKPEDYRPLPIRSVRFGPALRYELAVPAVRSLLRSKGYGEHVDVMESEVPLR